MIPRILITSGEPAGIGPDIVVQIAQDNWPAELIVIGDPELLQRRAEQLRLPLTLIPFNDKLPHEMHIVSTCKVIPIALNTPCIPGKLNPKNSAYVIEMLTQASKAALNKAIDAIVTAPVHKGILNDAGFSFQGHTEFFGEQAGSEGVMVFMVKNIATKIALLTTHLPLSQVSPAITAERLERVLRLLHQALMLQFDIQQPTILVCGLNPHAGENGHLGMEEIKVITPTLEKLRGEQKKIIGPLSADTIFTEQHLNHADLILAMYHDQALPVVKYMSFGLAVNVTLGLPFIRTSVDHGTALDIAGTGKADAGSLREAVRVALGMVGG